MSYLRRSNGIPFIMRAIIPLSLLVSLSFVSCQKEAKVSERDTGEETRIELAVLKADLARLEHQLVAEQNDRLRKETEQTAMLSELAVMMRDLKESSKEPRAEVSVEKVGVPAIIEQDDLAFKRESVRLQAEGEKWDHLETNSGEIYHDLVINQVTDIGVVFRHRAGVARVAFADLPTGWQDRFYYDRERALVALKKERLAQSRYDRMVEEGLAAMKEEEGRGELEENLKRLSDALEQLQQQAVAPAGVVPAQAGIGAGIVVNPPIIWPANQFVQNPFDCPPVIQTPIVRTPVVRTPNFVVPTIQNRGGTVIRPAATPTVHRPSSRSTGSSTSVPRSGSTSSRPTVSPPASRSSSTATPVPRSAPTIQQSRSRTR